MDWLPLCKICGERHRLGFCPDLDPLENQRIVNPILNEPQGVAFLNSPQAVALEPKNNEAQAARPQETRTPLAAQDQGRSHEPHSKKKFDKRAYQRDLMRRRRAEGKAK